MPLSRGWVGMGGIWKGPFGKAVTWRRDCLLSLSWAYVCVKSVLCPGLFVIPKRNFFFFIELNHSQLCSSPSSATDTSNFLALLAASSSKSEKASKMSGLKEPLGFLRPVTVLKENLASIYVKSVGHSWVPSHSSIVLCELGLFPHLYLALSEEGTMSHISFVYFIKIVCIRYSENVFSSGSTFYEMLWPG